MSLIETLLTAKPGTLIWDKSHPTLSVKGLHLKVLGPGRASIHLYYRTMNGTQRRPKIGDFPTMKLADARKIAKEWLLEVVRGGDPSKERQEARAELTVKELFDLAMTKHWSAPKYQKSGWAKEVLNLWKNHLAGPFGSLKLSEVTAKMIREWHASLSSTPYAANRSKAVLSKLFSFAELEEIRPQNTNPCALVSDHPEVKRERFATEEEIAAVGAILRREAPQSPAAVAFLYLLILTGSRPRAIERARWEDLEIFEQDCQFFGKLTFDGKSGREVVILPPQAMDALKKVPIVSDGTITGIKMPRRLWGRIREEVGCPDLWARDWRRTFASVGMSSGVAPSVIGELQNHKDAQTRQIYQKLFSETRAGAAYSIAEKLGKIMHSEASPPHTDPSASSEPVPQPDGQPGHSKPKTTSHLRLCRTD